MKAQEELKACGESDGDNMGISKLRSRIAVFAGIVLVTVGVSAISCAMLVSEEEKEFLLQGTTGPYRGRVIDAQTKKPIQGAVVVAVWNHRVFALVQTNTEFYDAVEVLTDEQGFFVVNAPEIERRAPSRTKFPVFTIFKPGYLFFRGWFADEKEMAQRRTRPLLGTVSLEPVAGKGRRQRLHNAGVLPGDVPESKIPNLMRAYEEELDAINKER